MYFLPIKKCSMYVSCTIVQKFLGVGFFIFFLGRKRRIPLSDIFADGVGNNTIMPEEILVSVHIPHSRKVSYKYI